MKKHFKNESGFTLIELIMVIAILGILAAAGLPIFQNLVGDAEQAQMAGIVGAVRGGITTVYSNNLADPSATDLFPIALDTATDGSCTSGTRSSACFGDVLQYPVVDGSWSKNGNQYTHTATGTVLVYDSTNGTFNEL